MLRIGYRSVTNKLSNEKIIIKYWIYKAVMQVFNRILLDTNKKNVNKLRISYRKQLNKQELRISYQMLPISYPYLRISYLRMPSQRMTYESVIHTYGLVIEHLRFSY